MKKTIATKWLLGSVLALGAVACGDDSMDGPTTAAPIDAGRDAGTQPMGDASTAMPKSLCEKYGGTQAIGSVIATKVVPEIAGDCRINAFFASLPPERLTRLSDCLSIQAEELFGCPGVTYQGSKASNGLACRSMAESHAGLGIRSADFDALIEDVVAGLSAAGVESADIQMAAPALLGLEPTIVEKSDEGLTSAACDAGVGDGG